MVVFEARSRIEAPFEEVWAFHDGIDGLVALTPEVLALRVEAVRGPDGDPDPPVLVPGSEVRLSLKPLGVGPRVQWTSRITERAETDDAAHFRDEMTYGPFRRWDHTHRFRAVDGATLMIDRIEYVPPLSPLAIPFSQTGLRVMFRMRHRALRDLLE